MSYFAAALARTPDGWTAEELDLDGVSDVDEVADLVRDVGSEAGPALLFVEEDDEYVAILRVDADVDEPRVFVSDAAAAATYPVAGILAGAVDDPAVADADGEDSPTPVGEPLGDAGLLSDLGTSRRDLLTLINSGRTLPADVISEVCERAGCLDELETLRGT